MQKKTNDVAKHDLVTTSFWMDKNDKLILINYFFSEKFAVFVYKKEINCLERKIRKINVSHNDIHIKQSRTSNISIIVKCNS